MDSSDQQYRPERVCTDPLPERDSDTSFFAAEYRLRAGDVDQAMNLRLDGVARYLQDVANDNLSATTFGSTDPFWVVRRTVIDVLQPISWPASIRLERWCSALSTRWANMRVRLTAEDETDRLNPVVRAPGLIETEAFWVNVNENGMPSRISDDGFASLASMTDEHRLRWRSMHVHCTSDIEEAVMLPDRVHVLRSTDFDPFQHMNNSTYWVVIEDELDAHPDLATNPHRAVIEYLRPIAPGAHVTVRRHRAGNELRVWMMVDEQIVTTATVTAL
ncbi:acyl-[acyl-carrier-protein] thioesterase [Rhodococcus qingshengii]|uniref:acyl-[acyl-carrier-protein] thioesterase n=1 Tax=Rhodococcus qingshengii TaxID=334542 RepID=UPI001ADFDE57|nr:acyl-ACP thioesterase domain-containing protein [Rhodococcus qingshengii]